MDTKLKIISELENKPEGIHLRELSRLVKSGLPNVKRFVDILEKEKVIKKQKQANLLNLFLKEGPKTIAYLKQVNTEKFLALPNNIQSAINEFLFELEVRPIIVLLFGSYAKSTYTKNSDIDIFLVFQKLEKPENIENCARRVGMRTNTKLSPVYTDYKSFENNFLNKDHDFSKEIRKNAIVIAGVENYYPLLWRFLK